jgi:molybdenum cofactor synthesis domain-containing protein
MRVEIVLIGNELLIGKVEDTNGRWLIGRLLGLGVPVTRVTTIQDDLDVIAAEVRQALVRQPEFVVTSGGLGPTFDDMTIQGIARGLGVEDSIEEHPDALNWLVERYAELARERDLPAFELNESRRKMARVPVGAVPLRNAAGSAPAVLFPPALTNGHTRIIALPGVPRELRSLYDDHLHPLIAADARAEGDRFVQDGFTFRYLGESSFVAHIAPLLAEFPEIWVKSHPHEGGVVELHLTSFAREPEVAARLADLTARLRAVVLALGGTILNA